MRSLLIGMLASQAEGRPAHLARVHQALTSLPAADQQRLGVTTAWENREHVLTYRQVEYTFGLVAKALSKQHPDGSACDTLAEISDCLIEASLAEKYKTASTSLAVDWTDLQSWALGPHSDGKTADKEASWGRRKSHALGEKDEVFYGWYFSVAAMVADEDGPKIPELIRRINLSTCSVDPVPAFMAVLRRLAATATTLGDVLADSGYAHRVPANWALGLRALGADIVTDLHPSDRGPQGTHQGAICSNGNLYCPATPARLLDIAPLSRAASAQDIAAHDTLTGEAAHYKLYPISSPDPDGYIRVACPAAAGRLRCPRRPDSMTLDYNRPSIDRPPEHPPTCCSQKTITVAPSINAKTRQKHDYPSAAHRRSYARRTAAERAYASLKDPATNNIDRGWTRLTGLASITLFLLATVAVRNLRVIDAFETRAADDARRVAAGLSPRTRRRRRKTIAEIAGTANAPP